MASHFKLDHFRAKTQSHVSLAQIKTHIDAIYGDDADYEQKLKKVKHSLAEDQEKLTAQRSQAVLVILQGMDTAGKDGVVRHVMSAFNPQSLLLSSFKAPTETEAQHDFLWRAHGRAPALGQIGVFNRSYYEDVLVPRVHHTLLPDADKKFWRRRYDDIVNFETHLHHERTHVVKIFLHLSIEEQKKRLIARIDDPTKHWKFDPADMIERAVWDKYQKAYADCFSATTHAHAHWYIVPADDKKNARLIVAHILKSTLSDLDLKLPPTSRDKLKRLKKTKLTLQNDQ